MGGAYDRAQIQQSQLFGVQLCRQLWPGIGRSVLEITAQITLPQLALKFFVLPDGLAWR